MNVKIVVITLARMNFDISFCNVAKNTTFNHNGIAKIIKKNVATFHMNYLGHIIWFGAINARRNKF